jgi:hypothetical protein
MAYDALNPGVEKDDEESQYASLLAPAPMANGGVTSGAPMAPAAPAGGGGFVSFDRRVAANRDTLGRMHGELQSKLTKPLETAQQGIKTYETQATTAAKAGSMQPPTAAAAQTQALATAGSPDRQYAQSQANANATAGKNPDRIYEQTLAPVTEAQGKLNQTYHGPTAQEAASKYAELLSPTADVASHARSAANNEFDGLNSFDAGLMAGTAGSKYQGIKSQYEKLLEEAGASAGRVNTAIGDATKTYETGRPAWLEELAKRQAAENARQNARPDPIASKYGEEYGRGGSDSTRTVGSTHTGPQSPGEKEWYRLEAEKAEQRRLKKEEERQRWADALRGFGMS